MVTAVPAEPVLFIDQARISRWILMAGGPGGLPSELWMPEWHTEYGPATPELYRHQRAVFGGRVLEFYAHSSIGPKDMDRAVIGALFTPEALEAWENAPEAAQARVRN